MGRTITIGDLTFTDTDTVTWRALKLTGWDEAAGSSLTLQQKPTAPGAWRANTPQRTPRVIVLSGMIRADTVDTMQQTMDSLNDSAGLDDVKMTVGFGSASRWAMVSQQTEPVFTPYPTALVRGFSLQLVAEDPRKFEDALSGSTGLPSSSGGLTVPFTVPTLIGSTVVSGQCSLTNPGNEDGPVTMRITAGTGGLTGPAVAHVGSGRVLVFASSLTIADGDWLDVDMEAETVLANGQASRNGWVTQRGWSKFEPGGNTWSFSAITGAGTLDVSATPAWK